MTAKSPAPTTDLIPLDQLYLHAFNPRPDATAAQVESKASSLATCGLMQNLMGYRDPDQPGGIGIVAGGLRLRGLQKLAHEGWARTSGQPRLDPVPVQITDDPMLARAWAVAENVTHDPLNPADEVRAYAAMAGQGTTTPMIAAAFGVTEARVTKRLRLARLPDPALDALRAGDIGIDVARALTLADDPDRQARALDAALRGSSAHGVRHMLTEGLVPMTDRRARFVGRERYELEGGTLTEDLWGDGFLHDVALLDRLFKDKLEAEAARVQAEEGWAWAEICTEGHLDYGKIDPLTRLYRVRGELGDADEARLQDLSDFDRELTAGESAELDALESRLAGDFTDDQRAHGGIFVYVGHDGTVEVSRAWARKADVAAAAGHTPDPDDDAAPAKAAAPPAIPQACMDDLARIRLQALQRALLEKPALMLDLLAYTLASGLRHESPVAVTVSHPAIRPDQDSGLLPDQRLIAAEGEPGTFPRASADAFAEFRALGVKHRNTVLTHQLARAVQPSALFAALWTEAGADIRQHWTPDADNLFGRLRADRLDAIWSELTGDLGDAAAFAKLKKGEKATRLAALFSDASVREALGLSRAQNAAIDAWLPDAMQMGDAR